ncbi:MAG: hypothetical protein KDB23_19410 [Planctomycetales bacterium]|nr:hypothetical protein [Planctomycetales bacterium]
MPTRSRLAEDLMALAALIVVGVTSVFFLNYIAASFYASIIHYGPFELARALGGMH